ncbi:MAG: DEAD/DEAH box helicase, partial [Solirubrobacteraceae bacterium]
MRIARVEPLTSTRAIWGPFDYRLGDDQAEVGVGSLLRVQFGRSRTVGVVVELAGKSRLAPEQLVEPEAVLPDAVPADLVELARWMAAEYCSTPARALRLVLAPGARRRVRPRKVASRRDTSSAPRDTISAPRLPPPDLSSGQEGAIERVLASLGNPDADKRLLLHGVTGSGKTEVYLRAVEATLALARGAIVLVPEIALTPQTVDRFEARFGDTVAVLHSGQRPARRHDEWTRLRTGAARVCVGPRSAVFAPLPQIGLIVVDEEHEGSFKHEGDPDYDARVVAERRALAHGALLLLGSATPRPETVHRMPRLRL